MVMTTEMLKQTMEMMSQLSGGGKSKPAVEKLGTSHTYNGFKCQDVKITTGANPAFGVSAVSCVSPDIDVKEFEAYKDFTQAFAKAFGVDLDGGMPGYSVHSDIKMNMMGKNIDCTSDLLSISHDKLEDSLFVLPADYTVREAKTPPIQKP
jgi:hypothetical protein